MFTNVIGVDDDLGFGVLRVTRDQKWRPSNLFQPCARCCWRRLSNGVWHFHGLYSIQEGENTEAGKSAHKKDMVRKMARQAVKDYVLFPALSRRRWRCALGANVVANGFRNAWAYIVIVCGHFADGAEKFDAIGSAGRDQTRCGICGKCWAPATSGLVGCWPS